MQVDIIIIAINPPTPATAIGYTTQQMAINEQQTLIASGGTPGCGPLVYDWAITSGGGTLSQAQGASTVYTAPAANAECANNPTITLRCNGVLLDTLKIAVNAYAPGINAYRINYGCKTPCQLQTGQVICGRNCGTDPALYCAACGTPYYGCNDAYLSVVNDWGMVNATLSGCETNYNALCKNVAPNKIDLRSAAMKTAGCCPKGLL